MHIHVITNHYRHVMYQYIMLIFVFLSELFDYNVFFVEKLNYYSRDKSTQNCISIFEIVYN